MTFTHHCYSNAEAEAERGRALQLVPPSPRSFGPWKVWRFTVGPWSLRRVPVVLGLLLGLAIPVMTVLLDPSLTGALPHRMEIALAVAIAACVGFGIVVYWSDEQNELASYALRYEFRDADQSDLEWLLRKANVNPELDGAVRTWIKEGKLIRNRDIAAVKGYLDRLEPAALRSALAGDPAARTMFLGSSEHAEGGEAASNDGWS